MRTCVVSGKVRDNQIDSKKMGLDVSPTTISILFVLSIYSILNNALILDQRDWQQ